MKKYAALAIFLLSAATAGVAAASRDEASPYLKPSFIPGEHLTTVFSKTVAITGAGFKDYVHRVSGTADYTVTKATPEAVVFNQAYRVDGFANGSGNVKLLNDDMTYCRNGRCKIDRETSGLIFNPLLWGRVPAKLEAGVSWTARINEPWELGPPGSERVRVVRADPANYVVTLVRTGSGSGKSLDDRRVKTISIVTSDGKTFRMSVIPGESRWRGYTTICRGLIIGDEIMLQRDVTLRAVSGLTLHGEERAYTLLDLARDVRPGRGDDL